MRQLARKPLAWMIAAELLVVSALVFAALSMVMGTRAAAASPLAVLPATGPAEGAPSSLPALPNADRTAIRGPAPGLNVSAVFWRERLAQLNKDQVVLEQIEWRLVHGAMETAQRYLELTVLPSIQRAEHAGVEAASSPFPATS